MPPSRPPIPPLRPFVRTVWATGADGAAPARRERVLPTGAVHVVFRSEPLRVFDGEDDLEGRLIGASLVGGPRATYYVREATPAGIGVGALLHAGAAPLLLGVPAHELAGQHVPLEALWGEAAVARARDQIFSAATGEGRLAAFEAVLRARLPTVRGLHPAVAAALERFRQDEGIAAAVRTSGYSHRRFIALFREAVGLTPKLYCRVQRFQRALSGPPDVPLAALAFDAGYADQPHFTREFRELAGVSPGEYRAIAPAASHHVPIVLVRPTKPRR